MFAPSLNGFTYFSHVVSDTQPLPFISIEIKKNATLSLPQEKFKDYFRENRTGPRV